VAALALSAGGSPTPDRAFRWSLAGHGLLLLLVFVGGLTLPRSPPPTQLAIKATVVDPNAVRRSQTAPQARAAPRPEPRPEPKAEPKPEPKLDPRIEERKAEQQKEKRERQQAEQREKALQEKQRTEQQKEEKQKLEKEKKEKKEKQEKEKQAQEKAAAEKAKAAQAKEDAAQREIALQLEAEERLLAATESGALADYQGMISQKVTRNWIRPPGTGAGLECVVVVTQIPGGEVVGVRIDSCNGDAAVRRSIEAAVLKASPLPLPDDASLFDRSLRFTFKPEQ